MPSAIQVYAAQNITFTDGSYTQLGSSGFGIGNDPNAYTSGVSLGAQAVTVSDGEMHSLCEIAHHADNETQATSLKSWVTRSWPEGFKPMVIIRVIPE